MRPTLTATPPLTLVRQPDPGALAAVDSQIFGVSWSPEEFSSMLANPAVGAWLLREGKWDIGYVCYQRIEHEAEIYRIGVVPTWQGKGHGRWLLHRFLEWARARRVSRVMLEVREGNTPAVRLYESAGFRIHERRVRYYSAPPEDALIMDKRLPVRLHRMRENLRPPPLPRR